MSLLVLFRGAVTKIVETIETLIVSAPRRIRPTPPAPESPSRDDEVLLFIL